MSDTLRQRMMIETWLKDWFHRHGAMIHAGPEHAGDPIAETAVNLAELAADLADLFPPRGDE